MKKFSIDWVLEVLVVILVLEVITVISVALVLEKKLSQGKLRFPL